MISTTPPKDEHVAAAMVESLVPVWLGVYELVIAEFGRAESMIDCDVVERVVDEEVETTEVGATEADVLNSDEYKEDVVETVIGVTVPSFDPMEKRFMALSPGQQLPLYWIE